MCGGFSTLSTCYMLTHEKVLIYLFIGYFRKLEIIKTISLAFLAP